MKPLINKFYTPTCTFCRGSCFNIFRWNYLRIFNNPLLISLDFSLFNKWLRSVKSWACCVFCFGFVVSSLWLYGLNFLCEYFYVEHLINNRNIQIYFKMRYNIFFKMQYFYVGLQYKKCLNINSIQTTSRVKIYLFLIKLEFIVSFPIYKYH